MLSRYKVALLNRALVREATQPLQKQLLPFPTAQAADCISVSCQLLFSLPKTSLANFLKNLRPRRPELQIFASDAAALWRTAAVVRNRRDVADGYDVQPGGSQGAHRGFTAGTRTLHFHFHALHAELVAGGACSGQRSLLGGIGCALA